MNKKFALILVPFVLVASAACGTKEENSTPAPKPELTTEAPDSGNDFESFLKSECDRLESDYSDALDEFTALVATANYADIISVGRSAVAAGRSIVDACQSLYSASELSGKTQAINELEDALDELSYLS